MVPSPPLTSISPKTYPRGHLGFHHFFYCRHRCTLVLVGIDTAIIPYGTALGWHLEEPIYYYVVSGCMHNYAHVPPIFGLFVVIMEMLRPPLECGTT